MPRVVIVPSPLGFARYRDGYDDLVRLLRAEGFDVVLEQPYEERGGIGHASAEVGVYLFEHADNIVATAVIVKYLRKALGGTRLRDVHYGERRATIFDQDSAVVREIVIEPDDGGSAT